MYIAQSSSRYFSLILHTTHHGITTRLYHRSGQFLLNNNNEKYSVIGEQSLVSGGSWTPLTEKLSSGIFTLYRRGQNKSTESQTFIRQVLLTEKNQVLSHIIQSQSVALVFQFCLGNLWQLQFRFGWQNSRAVAKGCNGCNCTAYCEKKHLCTPNLGVMGAICALRTRQTSSYRAARTVWTDFTRAGLTLLGELHTLPQSKELATTPLSSSHKCTIEVNPPHLAQDPLPLHCQLFQRLGRKLSYIAILRIKSKSK